MVVKDTISIARHGICITTPNISNQNAEVRVQAKTKTSAPKKSNLSTVEVPLPKVNITNSQLWSSENPNLYSAEVVLILNGKGIQTN